MLRRRQASTRWEREGTVRVTTRGSGRGAGHGQRWGARGESVSCVIGGEQVRHVCEASASGLYHEPQVDKYACKPPGGKSRRLPILPSCIVLSFRLVVNATPVLLVVLACVMNAPASWCNLWPPLSLSPSLSCRLVSRPALPLRHASYGPLPALHSAGPLFHPLNLFPLTLSPFTRPFSPQTPASAELSSSNGPPCRPLPRPPMHPRPRLSYYNTPFAQPSGQAYPFPSLLQ